MNWGVGKEAQARVYDESPPGLWSSERMGEWVSIVESLACLSEVRGKNKDILSEHTIFSPSPPTPGLVSGDEMDVCWSLMVMVVVVVGGSCQMKIFYVTPDRSRESASLWTRNCEFLSYRVLPTTTRRYSSELRWSVMSIRFGTYC
ncbi:hypothetical protein E2C01_004778 [Portunus trituberculatus]|uniref:Uncharacterized protein n=1 Tax=Portunus trituberculatus TaxID=210409 RepID=A0A5B7CRM5_PORTR|nr:hypothetical protein [Portunus trituberculatus]